MCWFGRRFRQSQLLYTSRHQSICRRRYLGGQKSAMACRAGEAGVYIHACAAMGRRMFSTKRTARGLMDPGWVGSDAGDTLRRMVLGSDEVVLGVVLGDGVDRPADEEVFFSRRPSTDRSNCQSIPCCFLSLANDSRRASRSSFDLAILSGWWYSTGGDVSGALRGR